MAGALEADLVGTGLLTTKQFGTLSLAYAIPNVVLPLIGGSEMDRVGPNPVRLVTMLLVLTGSVIYSMSNTFVGLTIGNMIMGMGAGTLSNWSLVLVQYWFEGTEHPGKSNGVLAIVCNLSKTFAFLSLETVANSTSLTAAKAMGVVYSVTCFGFLFVYFWQEQSYCRYLVCSMRRRVRIYPYLCCVCMHPQVTDDTTEEHSAIIPQGPANSQQQATEVDTYLPPYFCCLYKTVFGFGYMFWLQVATNACGLSVLYAWPNFLEEYLVNKYQFSEDKSSYCAAMVTGMFLLAPLGGAATDYAGHRLHTQTVSLALVTLGFVVLDMTAIPPWIPVAWAGFWFAVWYANSFSLCLQCAAEDQPNAVGIGMGVRLCLANLGLATISYVAGTAGPSCQNFVFGSVLCTGVVCSVLMQVFDDGRLDAIPTQQRNWKKPGMIKAAAVRGAETASI
jgi:hypothetical protein